MALSVPMTRLSFAGKKLTSDTIRRLGPRSCHGLSRGSGKEDRERLKIAAGIVWLAAVTEIDVKCPAPVQVNVQEVKAAAEDNAKPICERLADKARFTSSRFYLIYCHKHDPSFPTGATQVFLVEAGLQARSPKATVGISAVFCGSNPPHLFLGNITLRI